MGRELQRITCVDDDDDILLVARLCLEHMGGFSVTCYASAREAIDRISAQGADLVLLDVMMPGLDGLRTLDCLRAQVRLHEVPIAFMSARVQPDEIADYRARGADGVIPKPFDPGLLAQQVRDIWSSFHKIDA